MKGFKNYRAILNVIFFFIFHYVGSFLLKTYIIEKSNFSWKVQIVQSLVFIIFIIFAYKGIDMWNRNWKKNK